MNTNTAYVMLLGGTAALCLVAGMFFLRYWRSSGDRFFFFLMASFWTEAANRVHMGWVVSQHEDSPLHYGVRLLSYGLILLAIWDKNRPRGK